MDKIKRNFSQEKRQNKDSLNSPRLNNAFRRMGMYGGDTNRIKGFNNKSINKKQASKSASTGAKPPTTGGPPPVASSPSEEPSGLNRNNKNKGILSKLRQFVSRLKESSKRGVETAPRSSEVTEKPILLVEAKVPNIKTPGMSTSMFMADGETITNHNNARNVNTSSSGYGSKSLGGINASTVSSDLSYRATEKQQLGSVKANPGLPKNTSATYGNTSAKIGNLSTDITPLSSTSSPQGNSSTPKGTHPNTGRPIYNTFEERQAARQRDVAAIKEKHKNASKNMQMLSYLPNKEGETSGLRVPYSLALEEKVGLVRNRKLKKSIIAARRDATTETQAPKPKPITKTGKVTGKVTSTLAGIANAQSGDRGLDAVKKLGAPTFRPITSLHTQMTPSTDIARGFDGTAYPRPGTRSNIPFVSKYDRNFGQGPVPIYEEAKNGGTGGKLVGKPPSTVTTDLTQSTHYNEEQAATDRRDQATARAKNPNFKRFDPDADARTAAYLGLNTTIGSEKPIDDHLRLGGRGKGTKTITANNSDKTSLKNEVNAANQRNNPLQSTSSREVVPPAPDGPVQPVRTGVTNPSLGEMSDDFDRANSAIKPLPSELAGISTLGEADVNAYGRAYNQSLVNNRIGRKAGFEDLKINDITMTDRVTGKQIAGAALSNHTVASVIGYGGRSLTTGYGMGWGNAWRASRSEHAIRAISVVNPLSRGNISGALETLGRTTTLDRLKFKANPGAANRFAAAAAPAFATGTLAFGMYDNQDMGELATNFLLPAVAIPSARVGIALGGMITPAKTAKNFGVIRGLGLAGGAVGGFVAGAAAVIGVSAGIRDVTSNTSSIRSMSKKIATSEVFVQDNNSRQSLTARQMSLNKLSRSGLNDRALLLSNEASQLKGIL